MNFSRLVVTHIEMIFYLLKWEQLESQYWLIPIGLLAFFVSVAQLRFSTELLDKFFLIYLLKSPLVQTQCRETQKGLEIKIG